MNVELIRPRLKDGFRPFVVVTSSGRRYPVPHPEFILLTQRQVIIADRRGFTVSIDPLHVVGLEDIPASRRRGPRRKSRT